MAVRTVITAQNLEALGGQAVTFEAIDSTNGMQVKNTGSQVVLVKAANGEAVIVTFPSQPDAYDRVGDKVKTVTGPVLEAFGPFIPEVNWGDGAAQLLVDLASVTGSPVIAAVTVI